MAFTYSKNINITIFGESHNEEMGIVIDGVAPGLEIDFDYIKSELLRRQGGNLSSPRKESDEFRVISGYFEGKTTGAPVTFIIKNNDIDSSKYYDDRGIMRPSHADYAIYEKSLGYNDFRGGGTTSGRLTSLLVIGGAFFKSILKKKGINIYSHIKQIGEIIDNCDIDDFSKLDPLFPVKNKKNEFIELIKKTKEEKDSIGGQIEAVVFNMPKGVGEPFFDSIESSISGLLFSIPAVKGVSFGAGEEFMRLKGSQASDQLFLDNGIVKTKTNNNGGINGGITNGMPIKVNTIIKATPSIGISQRTVDIKNMKEVDYINNGRNDPSILLKAPPIIEAVIAISLIDQLVGRFGYLWMM